MYTARTGVRIDIHTTWFRSQTTTTRILSISLLGTIRLLCEIYNQHYVSAKRWTSCPLARANHLMLVVMCPKVIHQEYSSRSTMPFHKGMPITKYSDPKTPNAGTFLAIQASWTFPRRPFSRRMPLPLPVESIEILVGCIWIERLQNALKM